MSKISPGIKKVATICVLRNGDHFLLLKRAKEPNKGLYTPLGGKLDPFETPLNAAIRETWEESGIKVNNMEFRGILTETSPVDYNWISYVYLAEIEKQTTVESDEGSLEWMHVDDLLKIPTPKTDLYIYKSLIKGSKFIFNAEYNEDLELQLMINELTEDKLI
ncbi:NUDIX hydrolase [Belliella aquatica]|uniref:7,8-dihydro-8-oxoguanine-triphosphatase n=1 Tax=Belliella aquatica TaxID=1323734 RepID=A0ABQ1MS57_9BACT|nr:NUDIX domain-containing protein [Belliella aquatica]MCH7406389.1 NUDIX domain-containing protein [Belliella aquatica]GGC45687.1 putative 7,8-dihydro-8-oxoguanine-triphosphatase [Belliella aquatica]